jgi:glycosyltransferase involved in cell wall biosynthesis
VQAARSPVKVLHVIPSVATVHGGPTRAMQLIERCLAERGISVETACSDDDGPGRRLGEHRSAPAPSGVVRRYFTKRLEFYKVAPGFLPWIFRHVREYDVVHIHALFSFMSVVAGLAAWAARVPYIVRPLGTLNRYGVTRRRPLLKRLSLTLIEGPLLRRAAAVHFTSSSEREQAQSLGIALNAVTVPIGMDSPDVAAMPVISGLDERRYVLFLARLDPVKNIESLLQAFALLLQKLPGVKLAMAGEGDAKYEAELKDLAVRLGLGDDVVWLGRVDGGEKAGLLAAATIFVLPSHSENFGIAAVEALMAGLPCILARGVAMSGDVEAAGAGLAVDPTAESIAAGLMTLLEDDDVRARMSVEARSLARERYSLSAMARQLEHLYSDIRGRPDVALGKTQARRRKQSS